MMKMTVDADETMTTSAQPYSERHFSLMMEVEVHTMVAHGVVEIQEEVEHRAPGTPVALQTVVHLEAEVIDETRIQISSLG
jgi:hypothetical protein